MKKEIINCYRNCYIGYRVFVATGPILRGILPYIVEDLVKVFLEERIIVEFEIFFGNFL